MLHGSFGATSDGGADATDPFEPRVDRAASLVSPDTALHEMDRIVYAMFLPATYKLLSRSQSRAEGTSHDFLGGTFTELVRPL